MSTMPPISSFGSAPVMTLSSPIDRTSSIQSRRSLLAIVRSPVFLPFPRYRPSLSGSEADRLDQLDVHGDLPFELLFERPRGHRCWRSAEVLQALAHTGRIQRLHDLLVQPLDDLPRS